MCYQIYVLYSSRYEQAYVGQTADVSKRLERHNRGQVKSTKRYSPWELIHVEAYASRAEAVQRERWLKSGVGRVFVSGLVVNYTVNAEGQLHPPKADARKGL